jgi:hypothetical protein
MGKLLTTFKDKTFEPSMKSFYQLYTDDNTSTAAQIYDSLLYVRGVNAGSLVKNQEGDDDVSTVENYDTYMPVRFYNVKSESDGSTPASSTHTFFSVYNRAEYAGPDGQNMYDLYADYNISKLSGAGYITSTIGGAYNAGVDQGTGDSQTIAGVYGSLSQAEAKSSGSSRTITYLMGSRGVSKVNSSTTTATFVYPHTSEFNLTDGTVGTVALHKLDFDYTAGSITNAYFIWADESSLPTPSGEKYFIKSNISWPTLLSGSLTNTGSVTFSSTLSVASTATVSGDIIIGKAASSASSGSKSLTFKGVDDNGTEIVAAKILTVDSVNNPQGQDLNIQVAADNSTLFTIMQLNSIGFVGLGVTGSSIGNHLHLADNYSLGLGTGSDLTLLHNGTKSTITNNVGDLEITQNTNDGDIIFYSDNGSGGTAEYFKVDGGDERVIFSKGIKTLDDVNLIAGSSNDLKIRHNGNNSIIENNTGDLILKNNANDKDIIFQSDDGSGSTVTYFLLDGSIAPGTGSTFTRFPDNSRVVFGTASDLQIYHDATNSYINNATGDLYIQNNSDDRDIYFQTDDGSGGTTTYFMCDGSLATSGFTTTKWGDQMQIALGDDRDLRLWHQSGNNFITAYTGDFYLKNENNDGDIIFQNDNGSGGLSNYIVLDGGDVSTKIETIKVLIPNLPTSDPSVAGQLWNSSGDLKISAG